MLKFYVEDLFQKFYLTFYTKYFYFWFLFHFRERNLDGLLTCTIPSTYREATDLDLNSYSTVLMISDLFHHSMYNKKS